MRSQRGLTLLEMLIIIVMIAIVTAIILPTFGHHHTESRRTSCASNLNQLAKAMFMYSDVPSNGVFPCVSKDGDTADPMASLSLLYNKYVADPKVFSCPSKPISPEALASISATGRVTSSYGYDPAHGPNDSIAAIAADWKGAGENSDNHGPNAGQNVMIGAGTIEFLDTASRKFFTDKDAAPILESSIFARDPQIDRSLDGVIRQK